jgi:hypothetical protein
LFNPSQQQVREFFCSTFQKWQTKMPLTPLETIAADWISEHPEYFADLESIESALKAEYSPEQGKTNPFLHLSMHLSISEQLGIDQPPGIKSAFNTLLGRLNNPHEAAHQVMECLGEMVWQSQRSGLPPDGVEYIECINRRATKF